jgi:hypothetical protein
VQAQGGRQDAQGHVKLVQHCCIALLMQPDQCA